MEFFGENSDEVWIRDGWHLFRGQWEIFFNFIAILVLWNQLNLTLPN